MAMRAWMRIPEGGLSIDGVQWAPGDTELLDSGWHRLLLDAGAAEITEQEFESGRLVTRPAEGEVNVGADDAVAGERGQGQAADPGRRPRARRGDRRVPVGG